MIYQIMCFEIEKQPSKFNRKSVVIDQKKFVGMNQWKIWQLVETVYVDSEKCYFYTRLLPCQMLKL